MALLVRTIGIASLRQISSTAVALSACRNAKAICSSA